MDFKSLFETRKNKEELVIVFDIGSASVGGALVLLFPHNSPQIVYTVRKEINIQGTLDSKRFISGMVEKLEEVARDLERNGLPHFKFTRRGTAMPTAAFCVLSSPWCAAHVRVASLSREKPLKITHDLLSGIFNKEIEAFKKTYLEARKDKRSQKEGNVVLEKKIIRITLNGYEVNDFYDREARKLEMLLFLSIAPQHIIDSVRAAIERVYHLPHISFHSFTLPFFTVVRDIWNNEDNFLLVDVSGELTEISYIQKGALLETVSFPRGRNFLVRAVSDTLHVSPAEALSLLNLYIWKKVNEEAEKNLSTILEKLQAEWREEFKGALSLLSEGLFLPDTVFLLADQPLATWFVEALRTVPMHYATLTKKPLTVNLLGEKSLSAFVHFGADVKKDSFLAIDSLFANKVHYL